VKKDNLQDELKIYRKYLKNHQDISIPIDIYRKIENYATKRGISPSEWIVPVLLRAINVGRKNE
jgi:hypothetical protein